MLNTDQPRFAEQQKSVDNIHCLISMLYLACSNNVEHAIFPLMLKKHLVNKFVLSNINVIWDGSHNVRADEAFIPSSYYYYWGGCTLDSVTRADCSCLSHVLFICGAKGFMVEEIYCFQGEEV